MRPSCRRAIRALAPCAIAFSAAGGLSAQQAEVGAPLEALRLSDEQDIDLNGRLDEAFWSQAMVVSDFTQQNPVEGGEPSWPTEVRIAYDSDNLYIAVMVFDDPDAVIAFQRERDAFLYSDDTFAWVLDTFRDGRTGYQFEINPAGAMSDGLITGSSGGGFGGGGGGFGGVNRSWDGIWEARTQRLENGWSAEVRIPFRTLNFDPNSDTWGINFERSIRRYQETVLWRGFRRNQGLNRLVNAGELTGLTGMSHGIGLEARPSAIASWKNVPGDSEPTTFPADVSLDLNYSITPSLRGSLSFNTDFAEVESDQRRVNLTRFPLFFPERRDFFLEGSSVFEFAPRSSPRPFFSRRIGLAGGEPIPINVGARLTGQVGSTEIGFYQMRTGSKVLSNDDMTRVEKEDFTVARVRQQIFEQSSVGMIYTRRGTHQDSTGFAPADRHTVGVDVALNTRRFFGDNNFEVEAFYVWNSDPEPNRTLDPGEKRPGWNDLTARGFRLNYPNDLWSGHVSYREFGSAYDPAVGFVNRNDFRRVEPRLGYSPRPAIDWIRQLNFSVQYRALWGLGSGILEERNWEFSLLDLDFESGDNITVQANNTFEYLDREFEISDGIIVQPGEYANWGWEFRGRTASRRVVSLRANMNTEGFWDGTRKRYESSLTVRPTPGVNLTGSFERNDVSLSEGDFTTNLYRFEGGFDPSPWVGMTSQVQFDNVSDVLGLFARLRWIITPGNEIYIVYTHNWRDFGDDLIEDPNQRGFQTLSRGATAKINYTFRF